jgi:CheY-like chemotaxis protein
METGEAMPSLLVVDDEANVLYSLAKSLQSDTLDVFTAQTGREGLEVVQRHRPDAVILDVILLVPSSARPVRC